METQKLEGDLSALKTWLASRTTWEDKIAQHRAQVNAAATRHTYLLSVRHGEEREFDTRAAALSHARSVWGLQVTFGEETANGVSPVLCFTPRGFDYVGTLKHFTF